MNPVFPHLDEEEKFLYGCLAIQHRLGYAGFTQLLEVLRSPRAVYETSPEELKVIYPRLLPESAESIRRGPNRASWEKILDRCRKINARIVAPGLLEYPEPLLSLNAPPPLLFMQGSWTKLDARAVAIVGTRHPTDYGRKAAFTLAQDLARTNVTIVSGLAVGIDAEAHSGALDTGRTLAVIGCGLDIPYPPENQLLRERIVEGGAVFSEFPPGAQPKRDHFPRRNRILSALAKTTVVIEAGRRSGALLTAGHARSQGKPIFAMPGSVFSPMSSGTHALLKRDALLATSVEDVLSVVDGGCRGVWRHAPTTAPTKTPTIPAPNEPVLDLWRNDDTCGLDRLAERARETNLWPAGKALAALMESLLLLEIRGLVQRLPGPVFRKTVPRGMLATR